MKLKDLGKDKNYFTQKASEINRNLALAGIAIIWIFVTINNNIIFVPTNLKYAIIFFIISLLFDLVQYIFLSTTWSIYYRIMEKKIDKNKKNFVVPSIFSNIGYILFYIKIISNIIAFTFLLFHLFFITVFLEN